MNQKASSDAIKQSSLDKIKGSFSKHTTLYIFVLMLIVLGILTNGGSLRLESFQNLLIAEAVRAFAALGVGMIIITWGIDLSIGQVVGLAACVSASFAQNPDYSQALYAGVDFPLIVPILSGVIIGAIFGLFNGLLVAYGKLHPFIATLGSMSIASGLQLIYTKASTVGNLKNAYKGISQGFLGPFPNLFILVAIAAF
ncbi:MAG: ABC transporter permease, partial [Spirochaetales bacterium]|nr:ABC transporter permease [Spirochaetales bacterium]